MGLTPPLSTLDRFIARSAFPKVASVHGEASKINAARIAVGAIMFWRTALVVAATYYYHPTDVAEAQITAKFLMGCGMLTVLSMYTVGFCTPLAGLILIAAYPYFDVRLLTGTLGTNIASLCVIALLLLNAGTQYSADAYFLRRRGAIGSCWRTLYGVVGSPNAVQMTRIYVLAFIAYALISFGALAHHANDEYWRHGHTVGVMLTNAYLSRHYEMFRALESAAPGLYHAFSAASVLGQAVFQFAMLPLVLFTWGRRFVVGWGFMFFAISLLCLQLSYLPYLELALWTLIFARAHPRSDAERSPVRTQSPRWASAYTVVIIGGYVLFLATWLAPGGRAWSGTAWERPQRFLVWVGLDAPQVFNEADLQMGERWPVIYRVSESGSRVIVPVNGVDGERLAYHRSDLLYYGNGLRWRHRMIGNDAEVYHRRNAKGFAQIHELCCYDYARAGLIEPVRYEVHVYENQSAHVEVPIAERYASHQVLAFDLEIGSTPDYSGD